MTFVKITMCHLKEEKCGLVSIWKCFRLYYKRPSSSSSGSHLPNCQPYLTYGGSLLLFMTLPLMFSKVRAFIGKPIPLLMKYGQLMLQGTLEMCKSDIIHC